MRVNSRSQGDRDRRYRGARDGFGSDQRNLTAMRAVDSRLSKLEQRFGIARTTPRYLIILLHRFDDPQLGPGPAGETYIKILDEAGFLPTAGFGIGMVDLDRIPRGLSAKEAERFVREHGA